MSFSSSGGLQYISCGPEILVSIFSCKNGDLKSVSFVTLLSMHVRVSCVVPSSYC